MREPAQPVQQQDAGLVGPLEVVDGQYERRVGGRPADERRASRSAARPPGRTPVPSRVKSRSAISRRPGRRTGSRHRGNPVITRRRTRGRARRRSARKTRQPRRPASSRTALSSADLPIPGSPSIQAEPPDPARTPSSSRPSRARSPSLPISGTPTFTSGSRCGMLIYRSFIPNSNKDYAQEAQESRDVGMLRGEMWLWLVQNPGTPAAPAPSPDQEDRQPAERGAAHHGGRRRHRGAFRTPVLRPGQRDVQRLGTRRQGFSPDSSGSTVVTAATGSTIP